MLPHRTQVGDFNLSRFLIKGSQFVQSSQLVNPRWCAPEVIEVGHYSKAADVYSFGIILWELLTWQQPWEQQGGPRGVASTVATGASTATHATGLPMNNWQIMNFVKGALRPLVPPAADLPGGAPPPQLLSEYVALMEACWHQDPAARPNFKTIIAKLRTLLGAVRTPGGGAATAAAAGGPAGSGSAVEPASNGATAAASTQAGAAGVAAGSQAVGSPGGAAEASTPGPGSSTAAAAAAGGSSNLASRAAISPAIADLLNLGDEDGQPGTSSSSRYAAPRATTAVGCPEQGSASLPRKTSDRKSVV